MSASGKRCARTRSVEHGRRVGDLGVLDGSGQPRVHGTQTLPEAPGLYFVGITVELAGQLREIAREARLVGEAVSSS